MTAARTLTALASVGVVTLAVALPASGARATVRDARGDAHALVDLTRAVYDNDQHVVRFRVRVRDLRRAGAVTFNVAPPGGSDGWYLLRVTSRGQRFALRSNLGIDWRRCRGVRSSWRPDDNIVTARIPHRCARIVSSRPRRALWIGSKLAAARDRTPYREVRRD